VTRLKWFRCTQPLPEDAPADRQIGVNRSSKGTDGREPRMQNQAYVLTPLPGSFFKFFKLREGRRKERRESVLATYLDL
jgi:hypothetical protein